MEGLYDWLIHIPQYLGEFANWLTTDIVIGSFRASPLAMLGTASLTFVGIILALHIVHLVIG